MSKEDFSGRYFCPNRTRHMLISKGELESKYAPIRDYRRYVSWKVGDIFRPKNNKTKQNFGIGTSCKITEIKEEKIYFKILEGGKSV